MENKNSSTLAALFAIAAMSDSPIDSFDLSKNKIQQSEKPKKGQKEFFFNEFGFEDRKNWVFKCFAINEKNAKRKFNKWNNQKIEK